MTSMATGTTPSALIPKQPATTTRHARTIGLNYSSSPKVDLAGGVGSFVGHEQVWLGFEGVRSQQLPPSCEPTRPSRRGRRQSGSTRPVSYTHLTLPTIYS